MKKQYCLEWQNKSGSNGFKSVGIDCAELAEKALTRKIKLKSCASARLTWNYVGADVPDDEIGEDHFYKGYYKKSFEMLGVRMYVENDIREIEQ